MLAEALSLLYKPTIIWVYISEAKTILKASLAVSLEAGNNTDDYPGWHLIFWLSPFFQSLAVGILFTTTALVVSHVTTTHEEVDDNLVLELFQSSFYPTWLREAFAHTKCDEIGIDDKVDNKLLDEIK